MDEKLRGNNEWAINSKADVPLQFVPYYKKEE